MDNDEKDDDGAMMLDASEEQQHQGGVVGAVTTTTISSGDRKPRASTKSNEQLYAHFIVKGRRENSNHYMCCCRYCQQDYEVQLQQQHQQQQESNDDDYDQELPFLEPPKEIIRCTRDCVSHLRKCHSFARRGLTWPPPTSDDSMAADATPAASSSEQDPLLAYHPNLVVSRSKAHKMLFTKLRDVRTSTEDFVKYSQRAMRILVEDALAELPTESVLIQTPCGNYQGVQSKPDMVITAVSIVRSGDCLLEAVRAVEPSIKVGKILIQRNESSVNKLPMHFYTKLPPGIQHHYVLLCDPMLATGGSALTALKVLCTDYKVPPHHILFINLICCPEGLKALADAYPTVKIVTAVIDPGLNDDKYIVPGLGDFGDRFYGTMEQE